MPPKALDPYATLGIRTEASRDEAGAAHRRLAKRFHPDVNPGPGAAERMRRINEAWRVLSDPARRSRYDAERRAAHWAAPDVRTGASAASWAGAGYDARTNSATWTTWPESRRSAMPRTRRARPDPIEPSFGDRPAVFVAVWVILALMFFIGTWLGSATL